MTISQEMLKIFGCLALRYRANACLPCAIRPLLISLLDPTYRRCCSVLEHQYVEAHHHC
jgi:hypothetical protein